MTKKFAAFDIDGTLFRSGLYREVVYELIKANQVSPAVLKAFADLEKDWKKRARGSAFREFEQAMANAFDKCLPGLSVKAFDAACQKVITEKADDVYVYTRDLIKQLKKQGYFLIAISGSQIELVEPFAEHYNFDIWIGQKYIRSSNAFTGEIIKTHKGKDVFLKNLIKEHNLDLTDSIAVGDSAGDIEMLHIVEQPIAFNPEKELFTEAKQHGWRVVVERKNLIYELESRNGTYLLAQTNAD